MLCKTSHFVNFFETFFLEKDLSFFKFLAFDIRQVLNMKFTNVNHDLVQKNCNWIYFHEKIREK